MAANFINNVGRTIQANKREPLLINGLPETLIKYPEKEKLLKDLLQ